MAVYPADRWARAKAVEMDQSEVYSCSFVIKIWLEETAEQDGTAKWRGHITHVPSGERRYFEKLKDIEAFIDGYLEELGVKPSLYRRLRILLSRTRMRKSGRK